MATDDSLQIAADAPSIYRPASPTRLLVCGGIAVAFALLGGLAFNEWAVGRYVWLGAGLLTLGGVLAVLRRISARSSEHIRIDSDSITWVSPGQFRSLSWRSIEELRVKPWLTIELSDATHASTIPVTRRFERFPYLVAEVLQRLESVHESRMSRTHFGPKAFASSIRIELLEALGGAFFTAACAWMAPFAFLFGVAGLPVTMLRLGRAPRQIGVDRTLTVTTLLGTTEIPLDAIAGVSLISDERGRIGIHLQHVVGESTIIRLSRLTDSPLDLYDRLRRLIDERHGTSASAAAVTRRIAPLRAALFVSACTVVWVGCAGMPVFTGQVLHFAAERGYLRVAEIALKLGSAVDIKSRGETTPLYVAARAGHQPIVTLLLANGADPAKQCRNMGFTSLHVAAEYGHVDIVRELLARGVPVDIRNRWGQTPLWQAAWQTRPPIVAVIEILLDAGAKIDAQDKDGFAPIHLAVKHQNLPVLAYLVKRGARVNVATYKGSTPADVAKRNGCTDCLRVIGEAGGDLNQLDSRGHTLLGTAVERGDRAAVEALVAGGAKADVPRGDGFSPLQLAAWEGKADLMALLLKGSVDVDAGSAKVPPPLYLAVQRHHRDVVRLLLRKGARWDIPFEGYTALQRAAYEGDTDILSAMLDAGADPNAGSLTHPPPLILAAERGHLAIVQLLVERGANPDISFDGWSALRAAKLRGHSKTIEYLTARQRLLPEKS